jgi:diguanylate cyclase (GGDEF)-like protein
MPEASADRAKWPLKSLPAKVFVFVLVAGLVRLLIEGSVFLEASSALFRDGMRHSLASAAQRSGWGIDALLAGSKAEVARLANAEPVRVKVALRARDSARQELESLLVKERAGGSAFDGLFAIDAAGGVIASAGSPRDLDGSSSRELAGVQVATISRLALPDGSSSTIASAPVRDRRGRRIASLHGVVGAERLARLMPEKLLAVPGAGHLLIANDDAVLVGEKLSPSLARQRFPVGSIRRGAPPRIDVHTDSHGEEHLLAAVALESANWTLVLRAPEAGVAHLASPLVFRITLIDVFGLLLVAAIAYLIATRLVQPLENLSRGAEGISKGDLEVAVPDPNRDDEIGLLTRTFNAMTEKLRQHQRQLETAQNRLQSENEKMQRANEVLAQLSITDGLTKLHNHRYFQDYLTREIKRVQRMGEPLSMILADIDDFKRLNDRLGHAAGDELLVRIAQIMSLSVRESDLLARYGGEEFVVLATGTDLHGAVRLAEKIRMSIADTSFILDESKRLTRVTVSIGVAQYQNDRMAFFQETDRALYRAKAGGKNCVISTDS